MANSASSKVHLLDLAAACVSCTVTASRTILQMQDEKNTRLKQDGSFVTDADFVAQGVIVQAIQKVSADVRIVGEESPEEMAQHVLPDIPEDDLFQQTRTELDVVYQRHVTKQLEALPERLPLAPGEQEQVPSELISANSAATITEDEKNNDDNDNDNDDALLVDTSRVSIIVDPLDGTKSYAKGEYDAVSILICILLDNEPYFGVVGKPFGYTGLTNIRNTHCATVYGGPLVQSAYIAGARQILPSRPLADQPRAVISSSRSAGIVQDFCHHLSSKGKIHPEPLLISGAGEKSLRLLLPRQDEALWFFPKAGTSRWDVAAPDALLRVLGGKLTNKYGQNLDYNVKRQHAENVDGVVACSDKHLHAECIRLFGEWQHSDKEQDHQQQR